MLLHDLESPTGIFTDENGQPCAGGLLLCLYPGTTIKKALYAADGTELANPATIGSDGYLSTQAFLGDGVSELQLYEPNFDGAVYDPDDFPGTDWALVRSWKVLCSSASGALPGLGSVAALQALDASGLEEGAVVAVSGYYASGDCPTRLFTLRDGTATGNGGTIFPALGGGRYWEWTPEGDVDVRTFGAVPGSNEDAVPSLISATAYANGADVDLWFLPGIYKVSSASLSVDGVKIEDGVSFLVEDAGDSFVLSVGKRFDIRLTSAARNASSAGKVLLDFTAYTGSEPVRTLWNEGWGETGVNDYDLVSWAPASAALRVSGNICLGQNIGKLEIESDCDITRQPGDDPSVPLEIGEVSSVGGQALIQYGVYQIGKAYSSAVLFGRSFSGDANVLVDANWVMTSAYASANYSGTILHGVPGGGLVSVTTAPPPGSPTITIGGVVSDQPIFGAVSVYAGGGIVCADASKPVKARHFSTIDDNALSVVAVANGRVVDLEGRQASVAEKHIDAVIENGSVSVPDGTTFVGAPDGGAMTFRNCRISFGTGCSFGRFSPGFIPVYPVLVGCQVSGGFTAEKITATDSTFDTSLVLAGDMGDTILLRNTYTGAGSALDVSGVTSWGGVCRVAENNPVSVQRNPDSATPPRAYWPQTEGEARSTTSSADIDFTTANTKTMLAPITLRTAYGNNTAKAVYCESITNGVRVNSADGTAPGSSSIWCVRWNFTKEA